MSADGFLFNGVFSRRPGVKVAINTSSLNPVALGSELVEAIIGQCLGGTPGVPMSFETPGDAITQLRGGEVLTAVLRAFNPSNQYPGASKVVVVRANPASQAALILKDSNNDNTLSLVSVNYGMLDNQIWILVQTGSVPLASGIPSYKITVGNAINQYPQDNLGDKAFSVWYSGAGSTPEITVNGTEVALTSSVGGEAVTVQLSQYTTIQQVVQFINQHPVWNATVLTGAPSKPSAPVTTPIPGGTAVTGGLDYVTALAVGTTSNTATVITRSLAAIIDWLNSNAQPLVVAARASTGTGAPVVAGTPVPLFLSGGAEINTSGGGGNTIHLDGTSDTSPTVEVAHDWAYAINSLASQVVDILVPIFGTGNEANEDAIAALVNQHCITTSNNGLLSRRTIMGSCLGEASSGNLAQVLAHIFALNSNRAAYCPIGFIDNDDITGALTTYPGYITAAAIAGLFCGIPNVGDSATNLPLRGLGLEWLPSASDLENLLANGGLPVEYVVGQNYIKVTRAINTWLQDSNFYNVEIATGLNVDQLNYDLTLGLTGPQAGFIGKKGSPALLQRVSSAITTLLTQEENNNIIVGDATNPAWDDLVCTLQGDVIMASVSASIGVPNNFIGLAISVNAFQGSVTVTTGT